MPQPGLACFFRDSGDTEGLKTFRKAKRQPDASTARDSQRKSHLERQNEQLRLRLIQSDQRRSHWQRETATLRKKAWLAETRVKSLEAKLRDRNRQQTQRHWKPKVLDAHPERQGAAAAANVQPTTERSPQAQRKRPSSPSTPRSCDSVGRKKNGKCVECEPSAFPPDSACSVTNANGVLGMEPLADRSPSSPTFVNQERWPVDAHLKSDETVHSREEELKAAFVEVQITQETEDEDADSETQRPGEEEEEEEPTAPANQEWVLNGFNKLALHLVHRCPNPDDCPALLHTLMQSELCQRLCSAVLTTPLAHRSRFLLAAVFAFAPPHRALILADPNFIADPAEAVHFHAFLWEKNFLTHQHHLQLAYEHLRHFAPGLLMDHLRELMPLESSCFSRNFAMMVSCAVFWSIKSRSERVNGMDFESLCNYFLASPHLMAAVIQSPTSSSNMWTFGDDILFHIDNEIAIHIEPGCSPIRSLFSAALLWAHQQLVQTSVALFPTQDSWRYSLTVWSIPIASLFSALSTSDRNSSRWIWLLFHGNVPTLEAFKDEIRGQRCWTDYFSVDADGFITLRSQHQFQLERLNKLKTLFTVFQRCFTTPVYDYWPSGFYVYLQYLSDTSNASDDQGMGLSWLSAEVVVMYYHQFYEEMPAYAHDPYSTGGWCADYRPFTNWLAEVAQLQNNDYPQQTDENNIHRIDFQRMISRKRWRILRKYLIADGGECFVSDIRDPVHKTITLFDDDDDDLKMSSGDFLRWVRTLSGLAVERQENSSTDHRLRLT